MTKKCIFIFIFILNSIVGFSQENQTINNFADFILGESGKSSGKFFVNPPKKIKGSYHLFKKWKNQGVIKYSNNLFKIKNINLNIKDNRYESKIGNDSIFIIDIENIDYITINNRNFKNIYFPKKDVNRIVEIILENSNFLLIKEYISSIKINEPDPIMLRPNVDEYIIKTNYYIKKENTIKKFKLNKKNILNLFRNKKEMVVKYVKENKLKYKKIEDVKKILLLINNE